MDYTNDPVIHQKMRKLNIAVKQMMIVIRKVQEEESRNERASRDKCLLHHSYSSRMRLCVYHGVRDMYSQYVHRLKEDIQLIMRRNIQTNTDNDQEESMDMASQTSLIDSQTRPVSHNNISSS